MSTRAQVNALIVLITEAAYGALNEYEKYGEETPSLDSLKDHPLDLEENASSFKKLVSKLEGACGQLCAVIAPPAHTVICRAQDFSWSCLRVAVKQHIAEELMNYPDGLHVRELSSRVNIPPSKLASILRVLATRHCFREVADDVFANNRLSLTLLSSRTSSSFVDLVTLEVQQSALGFQDCLADSDYSQSFDPTRSAFMYTIKDKGYNISFYEWLQLEEQEERRKVFGKAMIGLNPFIGSLSALQAYPWDQVQTMCDVGSGVGSFTRLLLKKYPTIRGTLFDLPETIALAKQDWGDDFSSRVAYAGGSFFEEMHVKHCDVYYLRNILHNWPDDKSVQILRNIRAAVKPESRVLIHDYVMRHMHPDSGDDGLDTAPEPLLPNYGAGQRHLYSQDLTMLLTFNSKERTTGEVAELARSAGFRLAKVWDLGIMCILDFAPI